MSTKMSTSKEVTVEEALNCIYTDFLMLQDGSWEPDSDLNAIDCSLSMVERIAEILGTGLQDTRDKT